MGRLLNGIHGPFSGKVGPVIGSSLYGIAYIKSKPRKRSKKRKPDEKRNQTKFATAHRWLQPIIDFVREGFKGYSPRAHGFNAAKSYTLKHAFTGTKENKKLDPSLILVSYGDLPLPTHISVEKVNDYELRFTWDKTLMKGASERDQVMLLAYAPDDPRAFEMAEMELKGQFRENGIDTLRLSDKKEVTYHLYIAFIADDRSRQSDSLYLGTVTT